MESNPVNETDGLRVVKSMDDMDAETVLKHINGSHTPYAGMGVVRPSRVPGDSNEGLLRKWHDHIHRVGVQNGQPLNHRHGRSKK